MIMMYVKDSEIDKACGEVWLLRTCSSSGVIIGHIYCVSRPRQKYVPIDPIIDLITNARQFRGGIF